MLLDGRGYRDPAVISMLEGRNLGKLIVRADHSCEIEYRYPLIIWSSFR